MGARVVIRRARPALSFIDVLFRRARGIRARSSLALLIRQSFCRASSVLPVYPNGAWAADAALFAEVHKYCWINSYSC